MLASSSTAVSSPISVPGGSSSAMGTTRPIRAHSDPNIFRNDRVLRTLIRREVKHLHPANTLLTPSGKLSMPAVPNYFTTVQTELRPSMRREVANWMLEVCEEEEEGGRGCQPEVYCLAVNYMDRFLASCKIRKGQLQLLGAVCLLVSWKVRSHKTIPAQKLIEYTDFNVTLNDLLEWEFLLLSLLDWDLSAVIAPDYVEHILQRLLQLDHLAWSIETTRRNSQTLIYLAYSHHSLAARPPSLIALAAVLTALRPALDTVTSCLWLLRDTPSPSSTSSCSTHSSPTAPPPPPAPPAADQHQPSLTTTTTTTTSAPLDPVECVIDAMQKFSLAEKSLVLQCMEELEGLMRASLPPSPSASSDEESSAGGLTASQLPATTQPPHIAVSRSLFPEALAATQLLPASQPEEAS